MTYKELEKDCLEYKQKAENLLEDSEKFKALFNRNLHCVYVHDFEGNFIDANEASLKLLGYKRTEIPSINFTSLIGAEQLPKALKALEEIKRNGFQKEFSEYKLKLKNGSHVWVETDGSLIYREGKPYAILGVARDITGRKKASEALRKSEEEYRLLVENANDAIFIVQDGQVKFPNQKAMEIGQYLGLDLENIPFINYVHPDDRNMVIDRHLRRLNGEQLPNTYSFRILGKDGQQIWAELNAVKIDWEGNPATLNFLRDITSLKEMETQYFQAQKMKAIGTLAVGLAHDFNNLLMCIQGNTSVMLLDMAKDHPHHEFLNSIKQSVESGVELTKQLLGFSRKSEYVLKPTNLNDLIYSSAKMFSRSRKEITIHRKYQEDIWPVEVDSKQIEQCLLNLFINACDAMPNGGNLYLETQNVLVDQIKGADFEAKQEKYVKISVEDDGLGMDEKIRQKIFEPYFTTKELGKGNGLGLAIVYSIIKSHEGNIDVSSKEKSGTTFSIYLPATEKEISKINPDKRLAIREKSSVDQIKKGLTVLVVDDDDRILSVLTNILSKTECRALVAPSGESAIDLYKKNRDNIDLVILDMIMPDMYGGVAYSKIREINPDVKVLLTSGLKMNNEAHNILNFGGVGFLQKPFTVKALFEEINVILG